MLKVTTTKEVISTGIREISEELGGGIRPGTLMFIEGQSESGKSVLAQHLACGALRGFEKGAVAYYTSEYSVAGLIKQMDSLSLGVTEHFLADRLRIYPMTVRNYFGETQKYLLQVLLAHLSRLPERFQLVIIDSVTLFLTHAKLRPTLDFFQGCRELCQQDRTVVLVANSLALGKETLSRAFDLSDDYLALRTEDALQESDQLEQRVLKVLEVTKLNGALRPRRSVIRFEIRPKTGIHILPFLKVNV